MTRQFFRTVCLLVVVIGFYLQQLRVEFAEAQMVPISFVGAVQDDSSSRSAHFLPPGPVVHQPKYLAAGGRVSKFESMIKEVLAWLKARRKPHVPMDDREVRRLAEICDETLPSGHEIELPSVEGAGGSRKAKTTPDGGVRVDGPHGPGGASWHNNLHVHIDNATGNKVCFLDDWGTPKVRPSSGGK